MRFSGGEARQALDAVPRAPWSLAAPAALHGEIGTTRGDGRYEVASPATRAATNTTGVGGPMRFSGGEAGEMIREAEVSRRCCSCSSRARTRNDS
jgi:hypothetical protein